IENVASQISQGNYRIRLDQITKDGLGSLSVSLNKMAESLQQSFDTLEEKEWLQAGIANLNEQMVGEKEIPVLVNDILVNVANYTECQVATVYVMGDDHLLHLEGSYAADQNLLKPVLHPGEGISGQCFQSGNPIILKGIHGDEMSITYATGKARPASIVAVNIVRDRVPIGVLEVASLNEFSPMQIEYLNNISESIGIAINTAQNRKKLQELLEETQAQSEELQTQHSEL